MEKFCITGMHRTGTSYMARLLYEAGFNFGDPDQLMPPNEYNPEGYFENVKIVKINNAILKKLGMTWDNVKVPEKGWSRHWRFSFLKWKAKRILKTLDVWKDPRICITYEFWESIVPHLKVVLMSRSRIAVALSLKRRDRMELSRARKLWSLYYLSVFKFIHPFERFPVRLEFLKEHPDVEVATIKNWLGLKDTHKK